MRKAAKGIESLYLIDEFNKEQQGIKSRKLYFEAIIPKNIFLNKYFYIKTIIVYFNLNNLTVG